MLSVMPMASASSLDVILSFHCYSLDTPSIDAAVVEAPHSLHTVSFNCPRLFPIHQGGQHHCTVHFMFDGHAQLFAAENG